MAEARAQKRTVAADQIATPARKRKKEADEIPDRTKTLIRKLWRTPKFAGSFSGLSNFRACLALQKDIHISRIELFKIMQTDEDFILETKRRRKRFERRKIVVHGFGSIWQADLGEMMENSNMKYFLCCIDLFSYNIYCRSLERSKRSLSKYLQGSQSCAAEIRN